METNGKLLLVEDLKVYFYTVEGEVCAVNGVTFAVPRGKILGLIGESGCGKSVTAYAILRLVQKPGRIVSGTIRMYPGKGGEIDITGLSEKSDMIFDLRGGLISMIFQEPMTALSPVHTVGNQICEAILLHRDVSKREAEKQAVDTLEKVGIPGAAERLRQYPFEMSGGMRQRAVIAMALACNPELLIADEPTTALDVTIQAQIMVLIKERQEKTGCSVLLITHDLGVIAQMADEVAVMYLGRIVEQAGIRTIMKAPRHPYMLALLQSLPSLNQDKQELPSIEGSVPSMAMLPPGCPFHPRCPYAESGRCDLGAPPPLREVAPNHQVACIRAEEITGQEAKPEGKSR